MMTLLFFLFCLVLGYKIGRLYYWFAPSCICHICQNPEKKLSRHDYIFYGGTHKICRERWNNHAPTING